MKTSNKIFFKSSNDNFLSLDSNGKRLLHPLFDRPYNQLTHVVCIHCNKIYNLSKAKLKYDFNEIITPCCNRNISGENFNSNFFKIKLNNIIKT